MELKLVLAALAVAAHAQDQAVCSEPTNCSACLSAGCTWQGSASELGSLCSFDCGIADIGCWKEECPVPEQPCCEAMPSCEEGKEMSKVECTFAETVEECSPVTLCCQTRYCRPDGSSACAPAPSLALLVAAGLAVAKAAAA